MKLLAAALVMSVATCGLHARTLDFTVLLDDEPVGRHRFTLREADGAREVSSSARMDVKVLGVTVYRYRHEATEHWRGDCLLRLSARTDDGGERSEVNRTLEGCAMSFAYWNSAMLARSELLNAQTGRFERITITPLGPGRYRLSGTTNPIELQYSPQGEWIALDTTVAGGRRLSYRLR